MPFQLRFRGHPNVSHSYQNVLCSVPILGEPASCDRHCHLGQGFDEVVNFDFIQFLSVFPIWLGVYPGATVYTPG